MRFGDKLKELFDSFGLSYTDVSQATGIDESDLFDIVQNRKVPTADDLDILSYLLGRDIYSMYTKSVFNGDIFEFIDHVDEKNVNLDFNNDYELEIMKKKLDFMVEDGEVPAKITYTEKEYHRLYAKNQMYNHSNYTDAIEYITYYIKMQYGVDVMKDKLECIHPTDARIILLLVEGLDAIGMHKDGLTILKNLTKCDSLGSDLQIKCINLIAEIYESQAMYKESYHFADLGIDLSIKYNINSLMPDLLLWKALAEVALDLPSSRATIDLLIKYTSILRKETALEKYVKIFKSKFGIDIMRPGRYRTRSL